MNDIATIAPTKPRSRLDEKRLDAVCSWLKRAFQATGEKGFSIGVDVRRGWLAPYAETTGYIIPTCYRYAEFRGKGEFADMATRAAEWLLSIQSDDGSFPDFIGRARSHRLREPVVFNTAQDLFGLIAAHRHTGEARFLDAAVRAGHWLAKGQSEDGLWRNPGFGKAESASYYSRVTWPIQVVADASGDDQIARCARRGLEAILERVRPDYTVDYWGFERGEPAFTHTIAYTIEGLLEHGRLLDDDPGAVAAATGIATKTLELLEKDGRLAGSYDDTWTGDFSYFCTPGNCQLALIYWLMYVANGDARWSTGAERALEAVLKVQQTSGFFPASIRGTIPASWVPIKGKYMRWLYPNWGAKYLADALMFLQALREDEGAPKRSLFFEGLARFPG